MKRIVFLLCAVMLFACKNEVDNVTETPVVVFEFGKVSNVSTGETTAAITADLPFVKIDGKYDHDAKLTLLYHRSDSLDNSFEIIDDFELLIGEVKFLIFDLEPGTTYSAFLHLESSTGETAQSEHFEFTTKPEVAANGQVFKININSERGLFATVHISDIRYIVDNVDIELSKVTFEYRRYGNINYQEWCIYEFGAEEIADGEVEFEIPSNGEEYLDELETYEYLISLVPKDESYPTYKLAEGNTYYRFKMGYAEIEASLSTPVLTLEDDILRVAVERVDLFYDGVSIDDYKSGFPSYAIRYRTKGADEWEQRSCRRENGGISVSFGLKDVEPNSVYEFCGVVYAGEGDGHKAVYSDIAEICINPTN